MAYDAQVKQTINSIDVVPIVNAAPQANTTGSITSAATAITATDLTGVGSATVQISGTHSGINITFQASADNGTTFFPIQGQNQSTGAMTTAGATGVIATNATVVWTISPLLGQSQLRVLSTAFTSGVGAIVIHPSTQFTQPQVSAIVTSAPTTTVTGTVATTQSTSPWVTREAVAATPTVTTVTPTTTSTTLKAANANRKALILVNNGTSDCYVTYGATSVSTAYTYLLVASQTSTIRGEEYSGVVSGIWTATGGGNMMITETV